MRWHSSLSLPVALLLVVLISVSLTDAADPADVDCVMSDWSQWTECATRSDTEQTRERQTLVEPKGHGRPCPPARESRPCPPSVDCNVTSWSAWSPCIQGHKNRTRHVLVPPSGFGEPCGELVDTERCVSNINCEVSEWSKWAKCSSDGWQERQRDVTLSPSGNGTQCPELSERRACTPPVDCEVSDWTEWTLCQNATQTRSRLIITPPVGDGDACPQLFERRNCTTDCEVESWGEWQPCDANGTQTRYRHIRVPPQGPHAAPCPPLNKTRRCSQDCLLSEWSDWSSCEDGRQSRLRVIVVAPTGEAEPCEALNETRLCAIDCQLSDWGNWSACSNGKRHRLRSPVLPAQGTGRPCANMMESQDCGIPCVMSEWSEWSNCTGHRQTRTRSVLRQAFYGGAICSHLVEARRCEVRVRGLFGRRRRCGCVPRDCSCSTFTVATCPCMPASCQCNSGVSSSITTALVKAIPPSSSSASASTTTTTTTTVAAAGTSSAASLATQRTPTGVQGPLSASDVTVHSTTTTTGTITTVTPTQQTETTHRTITTTVRTSTLDGLSVHPVVKDGSAQPALVGQIVAPPINCNCMLPVQLQSAVCRIQCPAAVAAAVREQSGLSYLSGPRPSNQSVRTVLPDTSGSAAVRPPMDPLRVSLIGPCDCRLPVLHDSCHHRCSPVAITQGTVTVHTIKPDQHLPVIPLQDLPNTAKGFVATPSDLPTWWRRMDASWTKLRKRLKKKKMAQVNCAALRKLHRKIRKHKKPPVLTVELLNWRQTQLKACWQAWRVKYGNKVKSSSKTTKVKTTTPPPPPQPVLPVPRATLPPRVMPLSTKQLSDLAQGLDALSAAVEVAQRDPAAKLDLSLAELGSSDDAILASNH